MRDSGLLAEVDETNLPTAEHKVFASITADYRPFRKPWEMQVIVESIYALLILKSISACTVPGRPFLPPSQVRF